MSRVKNPNSQDVHFSEEQPGLPNSLSSSTSSSIPTPATNSEPLPDHPGKIEGKDSEDHGPELQPGMPTPTPTSSHQTINFFSLAFTVSELAKNVSNYIAAFPSIHLDSTPHHFIILVNFVTQYIDLMKIYNPDFLTPTMLPTRMVVNRIEKPLTEIRDIIQTLFFMSINRADVIYNEAMNMKSLGRQNDCIQLAHLLAYHLIFINIVLDYEQFKNLGIPAIKNHDQRARKLTMALETLGLPVVTLPMASFSNSCPLHSHKAPNVTELLGQAMSYMLNHSNLRGYDNKAANIVILSDLKERISKALQNGQHFKFPLYVQQFNALKSFIREQNEAANKINSANDDHPDHSPSPLH